MDLRSSFRPDEHFFGINQTSFAHFAEKSGLKSEKSSKLIMIDQLMREKVRDLSFINLEFHFERLIISEYSKFLKFFQSENSNYPGPFLIDQK